MAKFFKELFPPCLLELMLNSILYNIMYSLHCTLYSSVHCAVNITVQRHKCGWPIISGSIPSPASSTMN